MQIITTAGLIVIGALLFSLVIFVHELGHFASAKASGIRVNEFALGMGPQIFSFTRGETKYALRLFPIGGYCAMEGEDEESDDDRAFGKKPVWKRMIVILAGAFMNIVLGFVLMLIITATGDMIRTSTIAKFEEGSALQKAGMESGDRITSIDGYAIYTGQDLSFAMALADPDSVDFEINRDGEKINFDDVKMQSSDGPDGKRVVKLDFYIVGEKKTFFGVIESAFFNTFSMVRMVFESLKFIVTGRFGINEMAGPVGTAQVIAQAAEEGLSRSFGMAVQNIAFMIVLITVNLGIINLMPLPALDGGRFVFLSLEAIFRKPVPQKYEAYVHTAGFVLLICFMIFITFNDIVRIISG